jgi:predicted aspartyl protease
LPASGTISQRPLFPVQINGHTLTAAFDTGAQRSVLGPQGAARLGVGAQAIAEDLAVSTRGASGEIVGAALHQFRDFRIGKDRMETPVLIAPIALPRDVDVLIGLDYLAAHRLWLSYGSRRLFVAME